MRIGIDSFRGEAPRLTPRALPENGAQDATNARLLTGDLEAWRQFDSEQVLSNTGPVQTIYKLNDIWLAWGTDVDVARAVVAGDTTFRTFLTGPDEYTRPQWTNYAMAGAGGGPPTTTRPLGVPGPDTPPGVAAGLDPNPTTFNVDVDDEGDTLNEWTVGETPGAVGYTRLVTQENSFGHPAGSYRIYAANNGSQAAYMYRNFASENCTAFKLTFDYYVQSGTGYGLMAANVQNSAAGDGLQIRWLSDVGLQIALSGSWLVPGGGSLVTNPTVNPPTDTWLTCEIEVISNSDGTQTVTATIFNGSSTVGSVTTTGTFDIGGYSGLVGCVNLTSITFYDNIHVEGSGSTGYTPISTATSYAYTFVNDIGEESAPSLASATVLRPDGVAITVSTPTDVPTGIDNSEWVIQTKRIYRAVTGATGTFYRFVAEIPLATADYVDTLADTELGEVLESELWALPPVDMKGILALPNSVMVGFSKNQLCLSAQNHPHAWPVEYRLTVDTDIVAIGAIDTTVVVATKNFIYLAIGTDPSAYSMTKLEVPQACVAKRSLAYLIGIGVVFASPDGLIAVAGNGNVRNLTSSVFTREQWQALAPESIVGIAHDDVYHFFYDTDPPVPPAPALFFRDTFTGTLGTPLPEHTPDVAPEGFEYAVLMEDPGVYLNGSGAGTPETGNPVGVSRSNTAWEPVGISNGLTLRMVVDLLTLGGGEEIAVSATVYDAAEENAIGLIFAGTNQEGSQYVDVYTGNGFPATNVPITDLEPGAHEFLLVLTPTGWVLSVNGASVHTSTGGMTMSNVASTEYFINDGNDEVGGNGISLFELTRVT